MACQRLARQTTWVKFSRSAEKTSIWHLMLSGVRFTWRTSAGLFAGRSVQIINARCVLGSPACVMTWWRCTVSAPWVVWELGWRELNAWWIKLNEGCEGCMTISTSYNRRMLMWVVILAFSACRDTAVSVVKDTYHRRRKPAGRAYTVCLLAMCLHE